MAGKKNVWLVNFLNSLATWNRRSHQRESSQRPTQQEGCYVCIFSAGTNGKVSDGSMWQRLSGLSWNKLEIWFFTDTVLCLTISFCQAVTGPRLWFLPPFAGRATVWSNWSVSQNPESALACFWFYKCGLLIIKRRKENFHFNSHVLSYSIHFCSWFHSTFLSFLGSGLCHSRSVYK